jgi:hypothetical protein
MLAHELTPSLDESPENLPSISFARYVQEEIHANFARPSGKSFNSIGGIIKKTILLFLFFGVAALASYFYWKLATAAAEKLLNFIEISLNYILKPIFSIEVLMPEIVINAVRYIMGASVFAINTGVNVHCLELTAEQLLEKHNRKPAYAVLMANRNETNGQITQRVAKYISSFLLLVGASFPAYYFVKEESFYMAFIGFIAYAAVHAVGIENFVRALFGPSQPQYRKIIINYLTNQIDNVIASKSKAPEKLAKISAFIEKISIDHEMATDDNDEENSSATQIANLKKSVNKLILMLLDPTTKISSAKLPIVVGKKENHSEFNDHSNTYIPFVARSSLMSKERKIFRMFPIGISFIYPLGYAWSAFKVPNKIPYLEALNYFYKIPIGIFVGICNAISLIGLSYISGKVIGGNLYSDKPKLAREVAPVISVLLQGVFIFLASLSGGSNYEVNRIMVDDWSEWNFLQWITSGSWIYGLIGVVGASLVNYYYTEALAQDKLVQYYQNQDNSLGKYIRTIKMFQEIVKLLGEMPLENFDLILTNWLKNDDKLSYQLDALLAENLTQRERDTMFEKMAISPRKITYNRFFPDDINPTEISTIKTLEMPGEGLYGTFAPAKV